MTAPSNHDFPIDRATWWIWLIVVFYGASLYCVGLGGETRVLTRHEVLAAQPAREMLDTGRFAIPTFGGIDRLVKPPTTGWTIAAAIAVGGEAEWVVRLPAALAGLVMCMAIGMAIARYLGSEVGVTTSLVALTCYFTQMQARLAEADIFQAAAVTVSMVSLLLGTVPANNGKVLSPRVFALLFYAGAGTAFLYKAVGVAFVLGSAATFASWQWWRSRDTLPAKFLLSTPGLGCFVVMIVAWPLIALRARPDIWQTWHREIVGRSTGEMAAADPWHTYLWSVPMLLLPWVFFAPFAIGATPSRWLHSTLVRWGISWFLPGFVLLQLASWKHKHYVLPVIVPLTILIGIGMVNWTRWAVAQPAGNRFIGLAIWVAATVGGTVVTSIYPTPVGQALPILLAMISATGIVAIIFEHLGRRRAQLTAVFIGAWIISATTQLKLQPLFDGYRPSAEFARTVNSLVPANEQVMLVNTGEHHMAFYLRMPVRRLEQASDLPAGWSVAPKRLVKEGEQIIAEMPGALRRRETEGDRLVLVNKATH